MLAGYPINNQSQIKWPFSFGFYMLNETAVITYDIASSKRQKLRLAVISEDLNLFHLLNAYRTHIREFELTIEHISTVYEARIHLQQNRSDIALIDYRIGSNSGISLIEEASYKGSAVPTICLTLDGQYDLEEHALRAGAIDYLVIGSFNAVKLERCLLFALERKKLRDDIEFRSYFNHVLVTISADFINLLPSQLKAGIVDALRKISLAGNFDATGILTFNDFTQDANSEIFVWNRLDPKIKISDQIHSQDLAFATLIGRMNDSNNIVTSDVEDTTLFSVNGITSLYQPQSNKRILLIPLKSNFHNFGLLALSYSLYDAQALTNDLACLESLSQIFFNALHREHDYRARTRAEDAFSKVLEGTASATAQTFFRSLVKHLAEVLDTRYAFIAKHIEGSSPPRVRALAVWRDKEFFQNEEYDLLGSPTEKIMREGAIEYRNNVQSSFPDDAYLAHENIVSYMGAPLIDSSGKVLGVLSVMDSKANPEWAPGRWILKIFAARAGAELERLIVEEESQKLQQRLIQAQKMEAIGQLAAGIAHDLNNALFAVAGHLQLMNMSKIESPQIKTSVGCALSGCERASSLIEQLLCFSRQGKYNVEHVSLPKLVKETLDFLSKIISKEILIDVGATLEDDLIIIADPGQVQQALINVLINAQQAMPHGGTISLRYVKKHIRSPQRNNFRAEEGDFVCVSIKDTGQGISKDNLEKVFEPFFTTKETGKGSGLGLSMVYGIMQNHGGWVEVNSVLGEGSTFSLYFPIGRIEKEKIEAPLSAVPLKPQGGFVLVIDDEKMIVDLMEKFLAHAGIETKGFISGKEALTWYERYHSKVDLIVLDMKMPLMNGEECFARIRAINPGAQVIIVSGYIQDESAQNMLKNGALRFFQKPVRYDELISWIRLHTGKSLSAPK